MGQKRGRSRLEQGYQQQQHHTIPFQTKSTFWGPFLLTPTKFLVQVCLDPLGQLQPHLTYSLVVQLHWQGILLGLGELITVSTVDKGKLTKQLISFMLYLT